MPIARIQLPDGRVGRFEVPDGTTPEQVEQFVSTQMQGQQPGNQAQAPQQAPEAEKPGFFEGLATDAKNYVKSTAYSVPVGFGDEIRDMAAAGTAALFAPKTVEVKPAVQAYLDRNPEYARELDAKYGPGYKKGDFYDQAREATQQEQAQMRQESPIASVAGDITGAVITGGAAAGTKAGASVANSLRTGNPLARIAKGVGTGAVSGAAYGAGSADSGDRVRGAITGSLIGGATGGAIPAVAAASSGIKSTIAPKIEKPVADLAQRAKDFGINLRLDQVSPTRVRNTVQKVSQELPGSGVDAFEATQRKQWNTALAKTIGQDADDLGPGTIKSFLKASKDKFDDMLAGETFQFSRNDLRALDDIALDADETLEAGLASIVRKNVDKLQKEFATGDIDGQKLASIRSEMVRKSANASGGAKHYLGEVIEFLDDNISRSLTPAKADLMKQTRKEWRNYKTLEPLLEKSTDGQINPTELLNRVAASKYIKASRTAVGEDDMIDLARIGKELMPKKGGSDTAQKAGLMALMQNPLAQLSMLPLAPANAGLQAVNKSQKLVDLAIQNAGKSGKQLARPSSTMLIPGATGGMSAQ